MRTWVALFRGINVGGNNMLPMKELVAILEALGARNVSTYIQSGNAVLQHPEKKAARLSSQISAAIEKRRGFSPLVLLLGAEELDAALAGNPFAEAVAAPNTLHVGLLAAVPTEPDLTALASLKRESERFELKGRCFYLHAPEGVGRSKLAARAEKLLGVAMTDRNWRTVCQLRDMVKALA